MRSADARRRTSRFDLAGALGELLHARQTGLLPELRSEIQRLRTEAGFFVDAEIEPFILSQVGE